MERSLDPSPIGMLAWRCAWGDVGDHRGLGEVSTRQFLTDFPRDWRMEGSGFADKEGMARIGQQARVFLVVTTDGIWMGGMGGMSAVMRIARMGSLGGRIARC
jgi:hypothetical protein